jgi:hypothetical protein
MYLDALSGSGTKVTVVALEAINASNHIIRRTRENFRKAEITDSELSLDAIHQKRVHVLLDPGLAAGLKVVIEVNRYKTVASEADEEFVLRDHETQGSQNFLDGLVNIWRASRAPSSLKDALRHILSGKE